MHASLPIAAPVRALIRAVIFDVGGVLIHREDSARLHVWEERLGLTSGGLAPEVFAFPTMRRALIGLAAEADAWMELACLYRLHADEIRALADDFWACERLDAELLAFVRSLRPRLRTALLDNACAGARAAWEARFGLCAAVDTVILSAEERLVKPDTRIYALAAERLGVVPGEVLFIDDSAEHIAGARDAGMQVLQFVCPEQTIAAIKALLGAGDHRRDSPDERFCTPFEVAS